MDLVLPVSARRWATFLGAIAGVLVIMSVGASILSFVTITDPWVSKIRDTAVRLAWVDGEANIPAWYSGILLLICGLLLATIAAAQPKRRDQRWLILSLIFTVLSLDEIAQLHELSIAPLRSELHATGFLYYAWIIPAGICVALFVAAYWSFLAKLPPETRRLFVLAGALYVGGTLGVESLSGDMASLHGEHSVSYHAVVTVEESLEMGGLVLFIYALLDYISRRYTAVRFHASSRPSA